MVCKINECFLKKKGTSICHGLVTLPDSIIAWVWRNTGMRKACFFLQKKLGKHLFTQCKNYFAVPRELLTCSSSHSLWRRSLCKFGQVIQHKTQANKIQNWIQYIEILVLTIQRKKKLVFGRARLKRDGVTRFYHLTYTLERFPSNE